jgi:hypothetical protein
MAPRNAATIVEITTIGTNKNPVCPLMNVATPMPVTKPQTAPTPAPMMASFSMLSPNCKILGTHAPDHSQDGLP